MARWFAVPVVAAAVLVATVLPSQAEQGDDNCSVTLTGTPSAYETITAKIVPAPGHSVSMNVAWYRSPTPAVTTFGTQVASGPSTTYVVKPDDVGQYLHVWVYGNSSTYCSSANQMIYRVATPVASVPTVVGKTKKRTTVSASVGSLPNAVTSTFQWLRQKKHKPAVAIPGATGPTYKLKGKDVGKKVSVQVTYNRAGNLPTVLTSAPRKVH